ncbi:hypothetical protein Tco_1144896 [Tanacetum coccineum]
MTTLNEPIPQETGSGSGPSVADEVSIGDAVNTAATEVNTASAPVTTAGISVSTAEPITTVSKVVTTAEPSTPPPTTTTIIEDEDLIIAQTLMKMRSKKLKERGRSEKLKEIGVVMKEHSETAIIPIVPPQQHDPKDKSKDYKLSYKLNKRKMKGWQRKEKKDANIIEWDDVQAMIDADYELAARLQAKEQGELTVEEKSRLAMELIDKRKKHFARPRAEEQRRKPLTKAQKRSQMCTYVDDDDKEKEDLKQCFKIILEEEVTINAIPLATKPAPIIDFQIH